jgi:hypothetical protein
LSPDERNDTGHALVALLMPRERIFADLPKDERPSIGGRTRFRGVTIVEFAGGNIIEWRRFHAPQTELFDVVAIAEIFCLSAAAPRRPETDGMLAVDPLPVLAVRAFGEMT